MDEREGIREGGREGGRGRLVTQAGHAHHAHGVLHVINDGLERHH